MTLNLLVGAVLLCWGLWGIFDKKALSSAASGVAPYTVLIALYTYSLPIAAFLWLLHVRTSGMAINLAPVWWSGAASAASLGAFACYMVALNKTEATYVLGMTASYPVLTQFLSIPMLGEPLSPLRVLAAGVISVGVFLIGRSKKSPSGKTPAASQLVVWTCIAGATILWGIWGIFFKRAVLLAPSLDVYLAKYVWDCVFLAAALPFIKRSGVAPKLREHRVWAYSAGSALSLAIGTGAFVVAMTMASASYVIVITGCYPLVMYIAALTFLGEKANMFRICGITLIAGGAILTQFTRF